MATPTLANVRAIVRQRLRISANDPMFTDAVVNRQINIAYGNVLTNQPNGWWWQQCEETVQNGASQAATFPVVLAAPDNNRLIRKVMYVFASLDGAYWLPIAQRERTDQIRLAGGRRVADGLPLSWSILPLAQTISGTKSEVAIVFDPPLPGSAYVRYGLVVGAADLTGDSSVLAGIPNMLAPVIVEAAVAQLVRQKRSVGKLSIRRRMTEATIAKIAADEWMKAARVYFNSPAAGPGFTSTRLLP